MRDLITVLIVWGILLQCGRRESEMICGSWKLDSLYSFYNGFGTTTSDLADEPAFRFGQDKKLVMTIGQESRDHRYHLSDSGSLEIKTMDGTPLAAYRILKVNEYQLVLREEKRPLFKQAGQERFEIRFYSRSAE